MFCGDINGFARRFGHAERHLGVKVSSEDVTEAEGLDIVHGADFGIVGDVNEPKRKNSLFLQNEKRLSVRHQLRQQSARLP